MQPVRLAGMDELAINSGRRVAGVVKLVDDVVVGSEEEAISS